MLSYSTNGFTKRNINIVSDFITRYCGQNPQDTQSCECVQTFVSQNGYYTVDQTGASYSLLVAKRDNTGLLFSDQLCSSILCNTNPSNFDLSVPGATGAKTLIPPSIVQAKRQCPANACFLINAASNLTINLVSGKKIDLNNTNLFCELGGQPIRVQVNYDVLVQGYDVQPGIIGRAFYEPSTGLLTDQSFPRVKLTFQLLTTNPGITQFSCAYTINTTPAQPTFFNFITNSGNFVFTPESPEQDLLVVQTPYQEPVNRTLPCFGEYMSFFQATLTTTVNSVQCIKEFPVRVLMQPLYLRPLNPETPLPLIPIPKVQVGTTSLSRTTIAVFFLCILLLFYALGFLVEIALIRNFQSRVQSNFS
jgi:hypothetical protein